MKANIILRSKMFQNRKVSQIKAFPLNIYCIFQTLIIIFSIITYFNFLTCFCSPYHNADIILSKTIQNKIGVSKNIFTDQTKPTLTKKK